MANSTDIETLYAQSLQQTDLTAKQQAILHAAFDLFADKGFDHTTTKDIAHRAQVAEGTVYKHWKTKDELLNAVLAPFQSFVAPNAAAEFVGKQMATAPASLDDFLDHVVANRLDFAAANYKAIKIVLERALTGPDFRQGLVAQVAPRVLQSVRHQIDQLKQRNLIVDLPDDVLIQFLLSTVFGFVGRLILADGAPVDVDRQKQLLVQLLKKGLAPM